MSIRYPGFDPNDISARVDALASLMVTCALALESAEVWRTDVRGVARDCIIQTLTLGAYAAQDLAEQVHLLPPLEEEGSAP